jgi:hypothetical protein
VSISGKHGHGSPRLDGLVVYLLDGEAKDRFATKGVESLSQLSMDVVAGYHQDFIVDKDDLNWRP